MLSGIGQSGIHPIEMDWSGAEKQASRLAYRRLGRWFLSRPVCQPHHLPDSLCRSPTAAIVTAELTLFPFYYSQLTFYVGSSALSKYSAVRFLALAAALLSLGSPFQAATELHILFEHSSRPTVTSEKTAVKTIVHSLTIGTLESWIY